MNYIYLNKSPSWFLTHLHLLPPAHLCWSLRHFCQILIKKWVSSCIFSAWYVRFIWFILWYFYDLQALIVEIFPALSPFVSINTCYSHCIDYKTYLLGIRTQQLKAAMTLRAIYKPIALTGSRMTQLITVLLSNVHP